MKFLERFLDFIFPPTCAYCKKEGEFLCIKCWEEVEIKAIKPRRGPRKKELWESLDGVIYGADYHKNPSIQAVISQFKYRFNRHMTCYLALLMVKKLKQLEMIKGKCVFLIPVPLHPRRRRQRGFNQAELLCQGIDAKWTRDVKSTQLLKRTKYTYQQAKLNKAERQQNLNNAFKLKEGADLKTLNKGVCFLVDDVFTTGATLESAAKTLKEAGVKKVYGLVVARAFK